MLQPKDKDWLNGYKKKTPTYVVYTAPLPPPLGPLLVLHPHLKDPTGSPPHRRPSASHEGGEVERQIVINMSWGSSCRIAKNNPRRRARAERGEPDPRWANPPGWEFQRKWL